MLSEKALVPEVQILMSGLAMGKSPRWHGASAKVVRCCRRSIWRSDPGQVQVQWRRNVRVELDSFALEFSVTRW